MKYKINKIIVLFVISTFSITVLNVSFSAWNNEIQINDLHWEMVELIHEDDVNVQMNDCSIELIINNVYPGYSNSMHATSHYIGSIPVNIQECVLSWDKDAQNIIKIFNDENGEEIVYIDLDDDGTTDFEFIDKNDYPHRIEYNDKKEYYWDFNFLQTLPQDLTFTIFITLKSTRTSSDISPPSYYSPTSDPNGPYYGFANEKIKFDGTGSHDNDENGESIERYDWKFFENDNWHEDIGSTPTFTYDEIGDYTVTLRVYDNENSVDIKTTTTYISSQPNNPPSKPTVNGPKTGHKNIDYGFTVLSFDGDNDTIQYIFDWDDGKTSRTEFLKNGTSTIQTHNWTNYGKYIISVKAFDNDKESETTEFVIFIDVLPIEDEITGYIVDEDSDKLFDMFDNNDTGTQTDIEKENTTYLIDIDGDGKWDYGFDPEEGLSTYYEYVYEKYYDKFKETPGFELLSVITMIGISFFIMKKRKDKH